MLLPFLMLHGVFSSSVTPWRRTHDTPIIEHAMNGNLEGMKKALSTNKNVTMMDIALRACSRAGRGNVVTALVDAGADVHSRCTGSQCSKGIDSLMLASKYGHINVIQILLAKGADPLLLKDANGTTALLFAVKSNSTTACKLLLDAGANANAPHKIQRTPFEIAAFRGYINIVQLFITENVNVHSGVDGVASGGPLLGACATGKLKIVQMLIVAGVNLDVRDEDSMSGLSYAIVNRNEKVVALLLVHGANANNRRESDGTYPIMLAARMDNTTVITKALLAHGADVNVQNFNGDTALMSISMKSFMKSWDESQKDVQLLIGQILTDAGAKINQANNQGYTAFTWAVQENAIPIIHLLHLNGANVNVRAMDGGTPLMTASLAGHTEAAAFLLEHGADVNAMTFEHDRTPLRFTIENGKCDILQLLVNAGADVTLGWDNASPLVQAIGRKHQDCIVTLINAAGTDLEIGLWLDEENEMMSPLVMSVIQCDAKTSQILLNAGASLNAQLSGSDVIEHFDRDLDPHDRDLYQCSLVRDIIKTEKKERDRRGRLLITQSKRGNVNFITKKLQLKEWRFRDVLEARDSKSDSTPLMLAIENDHIDVVKLLLNAGADRIATHGRTLLHHAVFAASGTDSTGMIKMLIESGEKVNSTEVEGGRTALWDACTLGLPNVAELLIHAGIDVNIHGEMSNLQTASCCGSFLKEAPADSSVWALLVQMLVDAGAKINYMSDLIPWTSLEAAQESNCPKEVIAILKLAGGITFPDVRLRINADQVNVMPDGTMNQKVYMY